MNDTATPLARMLPDAAIPARFAEGGTYLIATAGPPTTHPLDLEILCQFANAQDTAIVVTTTESAATTLDTIQTIGDPTQLPALGFIDTTSQHQSVTSLFGDTPTVYTPSPSDLERLVIGLSDLRSRLPRNPAASHLLIRSLTPILQETPVGRLTHVLDRITGIRTNTGLCLFGIDYTAHDSATLETVLDVVDGVLWISPTGDTLRCEFEPARRASPPSGSQPADSRD